MAAEAAGEVCGEAPCHKVASRRSAAAPGAQRGQSLATTSNGNLFATSGGGGDLEAPSGPWGAALRFLSAGLVARVSGETVRKPAEASVPCCSEFLLLQVFLCGESPATWDRVPGPLGRDTRQKSLAQASPNKNHLWRRKPRPPSAARGGGHLRGRPLASS